jgi:hypothetical protein
MIILDWLVILVEVTAHQGDHVSLQEIPSKGKKLITLGIWEMKIFLNYLQLNCLILVPSWSVFIDHRTEFFMNFYINWSYKSLKFLQKENV